MTGINSKPLVALVVLAALAWAVVAPAQPPGALTSRDLHNPGGGNEPSPVPNIKSLTEWTYIPEPDGSLGAGYRSSFVEYDRDGYPVEQSTYEADGSVIQVIANTYDATGRLVESTSEDRTGRGNARTVFEYEGENLTGTTAYRPDGSVLVTTRSEYDDLNQIASIVTEVPDASTSQTITFEYDAVGNAVATNTYDAARGMVARAETSYDGDSWPIETTAILPGGVVGSVTAYDYDLDGNLKRMAVRNADGDEIQSISNVYDDEGRIIESVTWNAAGIEYRVATEYDADGQKAVDRTYNKLGQLVREVRYSYEYYTEEQD
jgi:hypothetical protein